MVTALLQTFCVTLGKFLSLSEPPGNMGATLLLPPFADVGSVPPCGLCYASPDRAENNKAFLNWHKQEKKSPFKCPVQITFPEQTYLLCL